MHPLLNLSPEIAEALAAGKPVVALESTIIAHGMPFPDNFAMARRMEAILREAGAAPATIAVLGGRLKAGLSELEIERIARGGAAIPKLGTRDLGLAVSAGSDGATTVASTMRIAHLAGIKVFATGGIGGVHRGAERTFDISGDLTELTETPVAVVSAGAKSILDLALTLERLETLNVPVISYRSDEFPAFYSRASGLKAQARLDSPQEIARFLKAHWSLGLSTGALIANPVPAEAEIPAAEISGVIEAALAEAARAGISGKDVTPFLLGAIVKATGGRSLKANIALVENNVRLAAEIAKAMV